jgi:mannose-6-phosphate isomerase-like protein (cupin superfamily)
LEEIIVKIPSEQTNDALCIVEHRSGPNAAPPLHLHRNEDEIFEILEGRFRFWLDGEIVEASAGATLLPTRHSSHIHEFRGVFARLYQGIYEAG